jgi:hypothetical protein
MFAASKDKCAQVLKYFFIMKKSKLQKYKLFRSAEFGMRNLRSETTKSRSAGADCGIWIAQGTEHRAQKKGFISYI